MRLHIAGVALLLGMSAVVSEPAHACYYGPLPIEFIGRTAQLAPGEKPIIADYAARRAALKSRIIVIIYAAPSNTVGDILSRQRQNTVRSFLISQGVRPSDMAVLTSKKSPPKSFVDLFGGQPQATVELTTGCAG